MRGMTGDLVGLVPPPEEPEPAGGGAPGRSIRWRP